MKCKYCGKDTAGEREVCPECGERLAGGESLPEKPDNAKADTSVREENPGDKQTKPEVKVTQRVYGSGNKSWLADRKKEDAEKNCRRKRRLRQYVRTEVRRNIRCGTVFGLYVDDIYDTDKYIRHVCSAAFDRTSFSGVFFAVVYIRAERHIHLQKSPLVRS